jgi:hypothetical protein
LFLICPSLELPTPPLMLLTTPSTKCQTGRNKFGMAVVPIYRYDHLYSALVKPGMFIHQSIQRQ